MPLCLDLAFVTFIGYLTEREKARKTYLIVPDSIYSKDKLQRAIGFIAKIFFLPQPGWKYSVIHRNNL